MVSQVEARFENVARIWHLHLASGQVIRTTAEHPFYVQGRGWVPAGELRPGDLLVSHDGQRIPVAELYDTGQHELVYNLAIRAFHTYFVCDETWPFSVWAHNACLGEASSAANAAKLKEHLRLLERYGLGGYKVLENGRIRYYGLLKAADKPGIMAGRRLVREWDPATGAKRTWFEIVDHAGRVRIVRPETGGRKIHYMFDESGNYMGSF